MKTSSALRTRCAVLLLGVLLAVFRIEAGSNPSLAYDTRRGGGAFGPSMTADLCFGYYERHSPAEVARQIRTNGFTCVHLVDYGAPSLSTAKLRAFADACKAEGLVPALSIYPGTHSQLYAAHPEWRQRMLTGIDGKHDWRTWLCPNQPGFVAAYCEAVERRMRECGVDALQIAEIWFENWGGPCVEGKPNPRYACVCPACLARFLKVAGAEVNPLDMLASPSSRWYFRRPENAALYEKWVEMRVQTLLEFGNAIIAAARRASPKACIKIMYMGDARVQLNGGREYLGNDLDRMVREWKPDVLTLQDAWQDWTQRELKPGFVRDYAQAYQARVEKIQPGIFIMSHADIGSLAASKRSPEWIRSFATETVKAGLGAPAFYEWHISTLAGP